MGPSHGLRCGAALGAVPVCPSRRPTTQNEEGFFVSSRDSAMREKGALTGGEENFLQASDRHPEFATELPRFGEEIKQIFEPEALAHRPQAPRVSRRISDGSQEAGSLYVLVIASARRVHCASSI